MERKLHSNLEFQSLLHMSIFVIFLYITQYKDHLCFCHLIIQIDSPMLASEWKRPGMLSHFSVVRKLDGGIFPMGFTKEATDRNSKTGLNVIGYESRCVILSSVSYNRTYMLPSCKYFLGLL